MSIKLLMKVYYAKVQRLHDAEHAVALAQTFISMVETDDYGKHRR